MGRSSFLWVSLLLSTVIMRLAKALTNFPRCYSRLMKHAGHRQYIRSRICQVPVQSSSFAFQRDYSCSRRSLSMAETSGIPSGQSMLDDLQRTHSISEGKLEGKNIQHAMECLVKADAVCFDVDSTVIREEGIDVLADFLGKGEAVAELTRRAMEGSTKFQDALEARLTLLQPSIQDIERCLQECPLVFSPGVEEFCQTLTQNGVHIYLVSGGFRVMIEPIAEKLNISRDRIVANTIWFDEQTGNYEGFDPTEPTSADMGKPKALERIKADGNYKTMIMVGDGATDAQAKPPADAFIGFGGVAVREAVQEKADWFVLDFAHLNYISKTFGKSS